MESHDPRGLAVVTGASSGIGRELARQLASTGFDLVIAADDERIHTVASDLQVDGVRATGVQVDLSTYGGVQALHTAAQAAGRTPDAVAINAGVGVGGDFTRETDLAAELTLIGLNVTGAVHLAKLMLSDMVVRGTGGLLFTSSIAGAAPGPYHATYTASRSFLLSFAAALRYELRDTEVTVTALMPGQTDTEFFDRAGMQDTRLYATKKDDPATVARRGVEALLARKAHVVAGSGRSKAQVAAGRVPPQRAKTRMRAKQTEPKDSGSD